MAVKDLVDKLGIEPEEISLGEVTLKRQPTETEWKQLSQNLSALGFKIIDDKKGRVIEKIKQIIIQLVHQQNGNLSFKLSDLISRELHRDYAYLSNLFSEVEGTSIEKYFIAQRIEKVKELLVYDELSLSEIAFQLNYSSVAYLSNQFKKITGLTPGHFKKIKEVKRTPLDKL